MSVPRILLVLALCVLAHAATTAETQLISTGATWAYNDTGTDLRTAWYATDYDDSAWSRGAATLGYGDGDEATVIAYGDNASNKHATTYFRHRFQLADASAANGATLRARIDDGAVFYLNGTEIGRDNLPAGTITAATWASSAVGGGAESTFDPVPFDHALLVTGTNILAVEVHQANATSSDLSFAIELTITDDASAPSIVRGPYLQMVTADAITIRWRTDKACVGAVDWSAADDSLGNRVSEDAASTEHELRLTGLTADTAYAYRLVHSETIALEAADLHFETAPAAGSTSSQRIWIIGDSGTANNNARAVYQAYRNLSGDRYTDLWLMLGDNAYNDGTDAQYQAAVFDLYPELLRQTPLLSTIGNHDGHTADSATQTGPYYDIFTLPTAAEAGGIASGTEAYYSFDFGQIHFVCLDSYETDRAVDGAMHQWLAQDLADNTLPWTVAFFHHPPYTKGSHNSDTESNLIEMRERFLPLLEDHGVDLVLCGHSHSYERSKLIDGHYGTSESFSDATHTKDGGDGNPAGDGAYHKAAGAHQGAIYVVAGSSGKISGGSLNHPAMKRSLNALGSVILDSNATGLDVRFLDEKGATLDTLRLTKAGGTSD